MKSEMPQLNFDILKAIIAGGYTVSRTGVMSFDGNSGNNYVFVQASDGSYSLLSQAGKNAISVCLGALANNVFGGFSGQVGLLCGDSGIYGGFDNSGNLAINPNSISNLDDANNLLSFLDHEKFHYNGGNCLNTDESAAYAAQVAGSAFGGATSDFKKYTAESWREADGGDNAPHTLAWYYNKCGLYGDGTESGC